jgi:hypothetical protein
MKKSNDDMAAKEQVNRKEPPFGVQASACFPFTMARCASSPPPGLSTFDFRLGTLDFFKL